MLDSGSPIVSSLISAAKGRGLGARGTSSFTDAYDDEGCAARTSSSSSSDKAYRAWDMVGEGRAAARAIGRSGFLRMTVDQVPLLHSLDAIYAPSARANEEARWNDLRAKFHEVYQRPADFVARAPGRVNLIGEYVSHLTQACRLCRIQVGGASHAAYSRQRSTRTF